MSVPKASHLIFQVHPWFTNLSKRLLEAQKLYFCQSSLVGLLVGIRQPAHPLRGAFFENWAMTERLTAHLHRGLRPNLYFLRNKEGHETHSSRLNRALGTQSKSSLGTPSRPTSSTVKISGANESASTARGTGHGGSEATI
ncbi:MAG: DUF4143 domain-containing protein [Pedosphaera sp.]|nr:DUF4143 domain-containing protein [Pedosphaera sp.]